MIRRALTGLSILVALAEAELLVRRARRAEVAHLRQRVAELESRLAAAMATIERELAGVDVDADTVETAEERETRIDADFTAFRADVRERLGRRE